MTNEHNEQIERLVEASRATDAPAELREKLLSAIHQFINKAWQAADDTASGYTDEDGDPVVQTSEASFLELCQAMEVLEDVLFEQLDSSTGWLGFRTRKALDQLLPPAPAAAEFFEGEMAGKKAFVIITNGDGAGAELYYGDHAGLRQKVLKAMWCGEEHDLDEHDHEDILNILDAAENPDDPEWTECSNLPRRLVYSFEDGCLEVIEIDTLPQPPKQENSDVD